MQRQVPPRQARGARSLGPESEPARFDDDEELDDV
jgi:hypothetical protein